MTASSASLMHQEFVPNSQDPNSRRQPSQQPQLNTKNALSLNLENTSKPNGAAPVPNTPVIFRTNSLRQDQLLDNPIETGFSNGGVGGGGGAHTTTNPTPIHTINEHHFVSKSNHVERVKSNDSYSQPISPRQMSTDDLKHGLIYKVGPTGGIVIPKKSSVSSSRKSSTSSLIDHNSHNCQPHFVGNETIPELKVVPPMATTDNYPDLGSRSRLLKFSTTSGISSPTTPLTRSTSNNTNYFPIKSYQSSPVIETNHILLEYDPITRRKVLNTYEILREIGRGEHGKVKLARDLIRNELVAIKIVNRKSRKERPALRLRKDSTGPVVNEYELKIKREIAIMKKCHHKHVVALKEVLDDVNSLKIYLVLEYMEKGEIKWKKLSSDKKESTVDNKCYDIDDNEIPCCGSRINKQPQKHHSFANETDLLSDEFSPNLTFKQSRKIFRDVLLGLEYLHMQGIVHRDIKPANLLVSADNVVKISDFGVSFASSLAENEEGHLVNELDLAKTAGTPAFFAPELCQFNPDESVAAPGERRMSSNGLARPPKVDYKIDIWALGVTLYCLLFGKVPFNAETEYDLFQVIVSQPLEFPKDIESFKSPGVVSEDEFKLAKDLLCRMLDKNRKSRIEIADIKVHPFTLMDLDDNIEAMNELFYHNGTAKEPLNFNLEEHDILQAEIDNAIIGIGTRFKRSLVKAIRAGGLKDGEIRDKFASLHLEHSKSENSEESSSGYSNFNSSTKLAGYNNYNNNSMILSEGLPISGATPPPQVFSSKMSSLMQFKQGNGIHDNKTNPHFPSALSNQLPNSSTSSSSASAVFPNNQFSVAGNREPTTNTTTTTTAAAVVAPVAAAATAAGKSFLQDMIESHSNSSSRRGSSAGISVSEAPQIETKRNVGGDLYLINQSAVETIKGLKLEDDKRRRSSLFSLHGSQPQAVSAKSSLSYESTTSPYQHQHSHVQNYTNIAAPIPVPAASKPATNKSNQMFGDYLLHNQETDSKPSLKIGPIGGISSDEKGLPDDSIMSLPLSESFASLDSINDDYLTMKYQEYTKCRNDHTKSEMKGTKDEGVQIPQQLRRKSSLSESDIPRLEEHFKYNNAGDGTNTITEKFKAFNLGNLMKSGIRGANFTVNDTHKSNTHSNANTGGLSSDEDPIAPVIMNRYSSSDSYSSYSSSSSSDEEDEESDEENLTLAFQSKVAPISRANFLSLTGRAKSHDSNLPTLGSTSNNNNNHNNNSSNNGSGSNNSSNYGFQTPIIFHDGLPEFEDVPDGLIGEDSGDNTSGYGYYDNSSFPAIISTNVSTATLTNDLNRNTSMDTNLGMPVSLQDSTVKISSPLNPKTTASTATIRPPVVKERKKSLRQNICNNQFNNHYKKGPVYSPFPNAKHLDNDEELIVKESENKFLLNRPSFFRSNSVTVGLLQRHNDGGDNIGCSSSTTNEDKKAQPLKS